MALSTEGAACIELIERMADSPPTGYGYTALIFFAFAAFKKFQEWLCPPNGFLPGTRLDVLRFAVNQTMQTLAVQGARRLVCKGELLMDGHVATADVHELVPSMFLQQTGLVAEFNSTLEWVIRCIKDVVLEKDFDGAWVTRIDAFPPPLRPPQPPTLLVGDLSDSDDEPDEPCDVADFSSESDGAQQTDTITDVK